MARRFAGSLFSGVWSRWAMVSTMRTVFPVVFDYSDGAIPPPISGQPFIGLSGTRETSRHAFGVTVAATVADFGASSNGVPSLVRPCDAAGALVSHYAPPLAITVNLIANLIAVRSSPFRLMPTKLGTHARS